MVPRSWVQSNILWWWVNCKCDVQLDSSWYYVKCQLWLEEYCFSDHFHWLCSLLQVTAELSLSSSSSRSIAVCFRATHCLQCTSLYIQLTLYCAVVQTVTFWSVHCHPGLTYIFNFWHSGTLALRASTRVLECPKLKM